MWLKSVWDQMWPNIFAPSVFTVLSVIGAHLRHMRQSRKQHAEVMKHIEDHHEEMKKHITGAVVSTAWMKPEKPGPPS